MVKNLFNADHRALAAPEVGKASAITSQIAAKRRHKPVKVLILEALRLYFGGCSIVQSERVVSGSKKVCDSREAAGFEDKADSETQVNQTRLGDPSLCCLHRGSGCLPAWTYSVDIGWQACQ